jgi:phosphoribosylformimino-5-aminoimidazole carboxamide ribotide isomerase
VVSIDSREGKVASKGWTETTHFGVLEAALRVEEAGCKRIIFTDIGRDGTLEGPNLDSLERLLRTVQIPVVASGGVSKLEDVEALAGLSPKKPEGVIVGKALYERRFTLTEAREAAKSAR